MANFMKVDFQDRLSKNAHCLDEAVFFFMKHLKSLHLTIKSAMRASEQIITCSEKSKFIFKKYLFFALDLARE